MYKRDLQHPAYLQVLRRLIAARPTARLVATGSANVSEGQAFEQAAPDAIEAALEAGAVPCEPIDDLPRRWTEGPCFNASSVAVQRELLVSMQPCFVVGESHGEDLDLWFRVAEQTELAFCPWPLIGRLVDPSGLSSQAAAREEPPFAARMEARVHDGRCPERLRASSLRYVTLYRIFLARTAVVCGRRGLGLALLWRARRAVFSPRWLLTLVLAALPRPLAHRIHRWRVDGKVLA
ncbi:MAG: hypothetical protein C4K60_12420 [Ideonella sp. MAG2]|nr:MAG: hypothetical protein C4K60_12420 [Ideonella sp. MAG2]